MQPYRTKISRLDQPIPLVRADVATSRREPLHWIATVDLRDIRYFSVLAEELNFTRAAERVGISTPGMSAAIKRLETECGGLLFERLPRGVNLTSAGYALRAHAERLIVLHDTARATMASLAASTPVVQRFGQIVSVPEELVAPVLSQLAQRDPAAAFVMTRMPWLAACESLLSGSVSATLVVSTGLEHDRIGGLLDFETIGDDPVVPIVRADHPRLDRHSGDDHALLTEEWVEFDPFSLYDEALDAVAVSLSGRERRITAVAPDTRMMFGLVGSSDRVGWCPLSFLPFMGDTVAPLLGVHAWRVERTLMLARRSGDPVPAWDDMVSLLSQRHRLMTAPFRLDDAIGGR